MKKAWISIILFSLIITMTGCASLGNSLSKTGTSMTGGEYRVTLYSGGTPVRQWDLNGVVSNEEGSDGWYFNCKNQVVRLSGDVVVESPLGIAAIPSKINCSVLNTLAK